MAYDSLNRTKSQVSTTLELPPLFGMAWLLWGDNNERHLGVGVRNICSI